MGTITTSYEDSLNLVIFSCEGDVGYAEIRDAIDQYYKGRLTRYSLWDFLKANLKLTGEEIRLLAEKVKQGEDKRPAGTGGADAIVVSDLLKYGLGRMYAAYSEMTRNDGTTIKTGVFRNKYDALSWIKQHDEKAKELEK